MVRVRGDGQWAEAEGEGDACKGDEGDGDESEGDECDNYDTLATHYLHDEW